MKKLVKFFKTKDNYYLYEAYNNKFYKVSALAYKTLPLLLEGKTSQDIRNNIGREFGLGKADYLLNKTIKSGIYSYILKEHPSIKILNPMYNIKKPRKYENNLVKIILNVTDNCNLRCKYCILSDLYPNEKSFSIKTMSWDTARSAVDYFKNHCVRSKNLFMAFYGGEPLLQYELIKRIVYYAKRVLKKKTITFNMTTNGTLLDKEKCRFLIDNDFVLLISIDGPEYINDRYRVFSSGRGSFKSVINGINNLKSMNMNYFKEIVQFNAVIGPPYNFREIEEFFYNDISADPDDVVVSFVDPSNTDFYKKFPKTKKDLSAYSKIYSDFIEDRKKNTKKPNNFYALRLFQEDFLNIVTRNTENIYKKDMYPPGCLPGKLQLNIDTNGKFHICTALENTYPIGNVYKGLDMEKMCGLYDQYYNDSAKTCAECWAIRLCQLCLMHALKGGRFNKENRRRYCKNMRKSLLKKFIIYSSIIEKNPNAFDYMKKIEE